MVQCYGMFRAKKWSHEVLLWRLGGISFGKDSKGIRVQIIEATSPPLVLCRCSWLQTDVEVAAVPTRDDACVYVITGILLDEAATAMVVHQHSTFMRVRRRQISSVPCAQQCLDYGRVAAKIP